MNQKNLISGCFKHNVEQDWQNISLVGGDGDFGDCPSKENCSKL